MMDTWRKKMVKISPVVCELKWGRKSKLCCDLAENWLNGCRDIAFNAFHNGASKSDCLHRVGCSLLQQCK